MSKTIPRILALCAIALSPLSCTTEADEGGNGLFGAADEGEGEGEGGGREGEAEAEAEAEDSAEAEGEAEAEAEAEAEDPAEGEAEAEAEAEAEGEPSDPVGTGGACGCDVDCSVLDGHAGICVFGVCMVQASGDCASAGSSGECPRDHRCWGLSGADGAICWPDCAAVDCAGACDGDGSCAPAAGMDCDSACGAYCTGEAEEPVEPDCTEGSCGAGERCVAGRCVVDLGDGPGDYPGITCTLPARECTGSATYCSELIHFTPTSGPGYIDYAENGETTADQYRSWLSRDLVMRIQYATALVACRAADWDFGNGEPLGFLDMSERDGSIPGTSIGSPGHPEGTHENGLDIDLAYYQDDTADNRGRPICAHTTGGADAYHCTAEPHLLDPWRSALFLGALYETAGLRVVGVDGRAGPMIDSALETLCEGGWISSYGCRNQVHTYETTDTGRGWYHFHHHHMHISVIDPRSAGLRRTLDAPECLIPGCAPAPLRTFRERRGMPLPAEARQKRR